MCVHTMALVFDRNPEFPVDPRFSSFGLKRKRKRGRPKNISMALDRAVPRVADQREEIEEGELPRGEVGLYIALMEEEIYPIGGEEGEDEEEGWVMGPNIVLMERGGEEREDEEEGTGEEDVGDEGTDEEEAEPAAQHTRFGTRWANFVRNLIE